MASGPRRNMFGAISQLGLSPPFGAPPESTSSAAAAPAAPPTSLIPDVQYLGTATNGGLLGDENPPEGPGAAPAAAAAAAPVPAGPAAGPASFIPDVNAAQSQVSLIPNLRAWMAQGTAADPRIFGKCQKADLIKLKNFCIAAGMDMREYMAGDTVCSHAYPLFKRFPDIQDLIDAVNEARARYQPGPKTFKPRPVKPINAFSSIDQLDPDTRTRFDSFFDAAADRVEARLGQGQGPILRQAVSLDFFFRPAPYPPL